MISVLIPVYNFDIRGLVRALTEQANLLSIPYEIILIDDRSTDNFRELNREISTLKNVVYTELDQNIGRSKIRNKLADESAYENLLFLDCDSKVCRKNYLKNYLKYCKKSEYVVYGGRVYGENPPVEDYFLHWYYGKNREEINSDDRAVQPNCCFMTNNFMISKSLFNKIRFNEFIRRYGHEDTLFGYELKKNNIQIIHIDNPLVHEGLEKTDDFIRKTQAGLNNLKIIVGQNGYLKDLINDITVLKYYNYIKHIGLRPVVSFLFSSLKPAIIKNLCSKKPKLYVFDFFKLGYLTSVMMKK